MVENKTKRIFADVSASTANALIATARVRGTTAQSLIADWAENYLRDPESETRNEKIPTSKSENLLESLLRSNHPTASKLIRAAVDAATELIHAGNPNTSMPEDADIAKAISDASYIATEARGVAKTGGEDSRTRDTSTGGRRRNRAG